MSTPDVTQHGQIIRKDDMELLTHADRVPERIRRLERAWLEGGGGGGSAAPITLDPWHNVGAAGEPAFQSGWKNYGNVPSGYPLAAFRKDPFGVVHLRGLIDTGTAGTAFTLPVGYRPPTLTAVPGRLHMPASVAGAYGTISIDANGTVGVPAGAWVDFSNIEFDTDTVTAYPSGPQGPAGATGAPGAPGSAGPQGPAGDDGAVTVYEQPNDPGAVEEGSLWIDTDDPPIYGPPGPQGDPGPPGEVYEQPGTPPGTASVGAVWIDTDEPDPILVVAGGPPVVTALPSSAVDGQEVYLLVDDANGVKWHFRYNEDSSSSWMWEFLGGPPLMEWQYYPDDPTVNSSWTSPQFWPGIALPAPGIYGDFIVELGGRLTANASGAAANLGAAMTGFSQNPMGGSALVLQAGTTTGPVVSNVAGKSKQTGVPPASWPWRLCYFAQDKTKVAYNDLWISVLPVRIGLP